MVQPQVKVTRNFEVEIVAPEDIGDDNKLYGQTTSFTLAYPETQTTDITSGWGQDFFISGMALPDVTFDVVNAEIDLGALITGSTVEVVFSEYYGRDQETGGGWSKVHGVVTGVTGPVTNRTESPRTVTIKPRRVLVLKRPSLAADLAKFEPGVNIDGIAATDKAKIAVLVDVGQDLHWANGTNRNTVRHTALGLVSSG